MTTTEELCTKTADQDQEGGVECLDNGDLVEWISDKANSGSDWPYILVRGDESLHWEFEKLWDLVLWERCYGKVGSAEDLEPAQGIGSEQELKNELRRIKQIYDTETLGVDTEFNRGFLHGRLAALAWVFGAEWEAYLDSCRCGRHS